MSKVKIEGNPSGTGTLTISAPNTNTDRTLTLPDADITLGGGVDGVDSDYTSGTAVKIDSSGHTLIGSTTSAGGTNGAALQVKGTTGVTDYSLALMDGDNTVAGRIHLTSSSSNSIDIGADPDGNGNSTAMTFSIDGVETMRIDNTEALKFNSGYGSVATAYGCRAWVNFDAAATSIRASGGVSSLTNDSNAADRINFSFTMPDTNYSVTGTANGSTTSVNNGRFLCPRNFTTTSVYVTAQQVYNSASSTPLVCVAIYR